MIIETFRYCFCRLSSWSDFCTRMNLTVFLFLLSPSVIFAPEWISRYVCSCSVLLLFLHHNESHGISVRAQSFCYFCTRMNLTVFLFVLSPSVIFAPEWISRHFCSCSVLLLFLHQNESHGFSVRAQSFCYFCTRMNLTAFLFVLSPSVIFAPEWISRYFCSCSVLLLFLHQNESHGISVRAQFFCYFCTRMNLAVFLFLLSPSVIFRTYYRQQFLAISETFPISGWVFQVIRCPDFPLSINDLRCAFKPFRP
jgi:hypothetical protein